uniref:Uncharacterized protein n=1 Tax=Anopheles farauti TaxID=69004 RepID=A0A182R041_9DIPT
MRPRSSSVPLMSSISTASGYPAVWSEGGSSTGTGDDYSETKSFPTTNRPPRWVATCASGTVSAPPSPLADSISCSSSSAFGWSSCSTMVSMSCCLMANEGGAGGPPQVVAPPTGLSSASGSESVELPLAVYRRPILSYFRQASGFSHFPPTAIVARSPPTTPVNVREVPTPPPYLPPPAANVDVEEAAFSTLLHSAHMDGTGDAVDISHPESSRSVPAVA